jgi:hypothetical protein
MCSLIAPKKNRKLVEEVVVTEPTHTPNVLPKTNMEE